jgi:hypothetical protein
MKEMEELNTMTKPKIAILLVLIALNIGADIRGADAAAARRHYNVDKANLALQGYDPVAYFDGGKPAKGSPDITADVGGVTYRFASADHRDRFLADPAKYQPAYGGWCATAMAKNKKVEIDPTSFKITDGRLFLFYKDLFSDARKPWVKDEANLRDKADANWKQFAGE